MKKPSNMGTSWYRGIISRGWKRWRRLPIWPSTTQPRSIKSKRRSTFSEDYGEVQDDWYLRRLTMTTEIQRVITRDRSSGRYHKRLFYGGRWMVDERCQTDQSGQFDVIADFNPADADRIALCRFCFEPMV